MKKCLENSNSAPTYLGIILTLTFSIWAAPLQAAAQVNDDWSFSLNPYVWAADISGDLSSGEVVSEVDLSLGDAVDEGNGAIGLDFTIRNGNWSLLTQGLYTELEDTSPGVAGQTFDTAKLEFDEFFITESLGYSLWRDEESYFDFLVGARLSDVSSDLFLRRVVEGERKFSSSETWVDPIVGFNSYFVLSEGVRLVGMADIGGFDAASALTWQAFTALQFRVSPGASLEFGYRALAVDYESGDYVYDLVMHGPSAGLDIRF